MNNLILPINVTWLITDRCNYDCQFCFRFLDRHEISFEKAQKIIDKLIAAGLKKISWAGGEPLLWPGMLDLIKYTHDREITTMLITNGELITEPMLDFFGENLDWLNLPLEGPSSAINDLMTRKAGHFERVIKILTRLKDTSVKLKINTVASAINIDALEEMVPIIKKYQVKRWKIFQFYPVRGQAIKARAKFDLEPSKFESARKKILAQFDPQECMVVFENNQELEQSYFSIAPDGEVYVSQNGKDLFLGNLATDSVESIWSSQALIKEKYWQRSQWIIKNA